ncbi:hypothetical protein LZ30DRAFT_772004 [Colletotrichum cereale]|nr:hypothetical protein LZ30DRAFT_772004 [Colletotrichum cereale]
MPGSAMPVQQDMVLAASAAAGAGATSAGSLRIAARCESALHGRDQGPKKKKQGLRNKGRTQVSLSSRSCSLSLLVKYLTWSFPVYLFKVLTSVQSRTPAPISVWHFFAVSEALRPSRLPRDDDYA